LGAGGKVGKTSPKAKMTNHMPASDPNQPPHVVLLGATGTIGRATHAALRARGYQVTCFIRAKATAPLDMSARKVDLSDPASLAEAFGATQVDAVVSCMASRSGSAQDAWADDHAAHLPLLTAAERRGVRHFVLLSAICVEKPLLEFQKAKLAFEAARVASTLRWSIVRPTAFFKSLSGQIARVQAGKPFLLFGDGALTACKPISDRDLGAFLAACLTDPATWNRILPIGGPGPALTPRAQGQMLFDLLGRSAHFRSVPVARMDAIIGGLSVAGMFSAKARAKAELARIGRYYATESMLVWDPIAGHYDAEATPEYGQDTLRAHYMRVLSGDLTVDLGDHAIF
jgi:divinyl chlorophyllide a 8-vinyl-reductase